MTTCKTKKNRLLATSGLFKGRSLTFCYSLGKQDAIPSLVFCVSFPGHASSACFACQMVEVLPLAQLKMLLIMMLLLPYHKLFNGNQTVPSGFNAQAAGESLKGAVRAERSLEARCSALLLSRSGDDLKVMP